MSVFIETQYNIPTVYKICDEEGIVKLIDTLFVIFSEYVITYQDVHTFVTHESCNM